MNTEKKTIKKLNLSKQSLKNLQVRTSVQAGKFGPTVTCSASHNFSCTV